jgi:hypothetical protein
MEKYGTKFTYELTNGCLSIKFSSAADSHDIALWVAKAIKEFAEDADKDFYSSGEIPFHAINRLSRMGLDLIKNQSLTMLSNQDLVVLYACVPVREDTEHFINLINYFKTQDLIRNDKSTDSILIGDQMAKNMDYTLTG